MSFARLGIAEHSSGGDAPSGAVALCAARSARGSMAHAIIHLPQGRVGSALRRFA